MARRDCRPSCVAESERRPDCEPSPGSHSFSGASGAVWSSIGLAQAWRSNEAREYIETAKDQLAALPRETQLLDEPVPGAVVLGWFSPYNGTSYVLGPLHDRPEFVPSVTDAA